MTAKDWLFPLRKAATVACTARLLVFPYAAAGATSLRPLVTGLPDSVELLGVSLPGRERRFGEDPLIDPAEPLAGVSRELADRTPLPTYLLGHSMGASLALLFARTAPESLNVRGVVISGRKPAGIALEPILALTDAEILGMVTAIGHTSPQLLNDKYWSGRLVQLFRSDTELDVRTSRLAGDHVLEQPILALGGDADPYVNPADLAGWAARTTDASEVAILPGDHFFLLAPANRNVIAAALARFTGAGARPLTPA